MKACNQILVATSIDGAAETLVLSAKTGVDAAEIVQVLSGDLACCGALDDRGERIMNGDFKPRLRYAWIMRTCASQWRAGQAYGVVLPVTSLLHEMLKEMAPSGRGDLGQSGLVTLIEELSQIRVKRCE